MSLASLSIKRPIAVSMISLGILIIGVVASMRIPFNLLPNITYPKVTIRTEYPHAAPEEVENLVTKPIEQAVGIINNVTKLSSVSRPGMSEVYVEFRWGVDMDVALMDIREKLQLLEGFFPEDVKKPILLRYDPNSDPIITIGVAGKEELSELRYVVETEVQRELERLDGVAAVKVEGGYEDEVVIELDEGKLKRYNLTPDTVVDRLKRENINLAGGTLTEAGEELSVRALNEFKSLDDIRGIIITSEGGGLAGQTLAMPSIGGMNLSGGLSMLGGLGSLAGLGSILSGAPSSGQQVQVSVPIRLGEIAQVRIRHKQRKEIVRLNQKECVKVSIYKEGDANIVRVAGEVSAALDKIKNNLSLDLQSRKELGKVNSPLEKLKRFVNWWIYLFFYVRPFETYQPKAKLVNDMEMITISDQSAFIRDSIYGVIQAALWSAIICVFMLYLFLRNIPSTWIIGLAIPTSIIATFTLMYFMGISFNVMSLAGLAMGIGNVVDNSIVVLENILRHRAKTHDLRQSAIKATDELAGPIFSSTLTNFIVFFPILFVEGLFRQVFGDLAWTVTISMLASIFAAMMLVPMLSVFMGDRVRLPKHLADLDLDLPDEVEQKLTLQFGPRPVYADFRGKLFGRIEYGLILFFWSIRAGYRTFIYAFASVARAVLRQPLKGFDFVFIWSRNNFPRFVEWTLARPVKVFGSSLIVLALAAFGFLFCGFELVPDVDQNEFRIHFSLPVGTPILETSRRAEKIEDRIKQVPGADKIDNIFSTVGTSAGSGFLDTQQSENLGEMIVGLETLNKRNFTDNQMMARMREMLRSQVNLTYTFSKPQLLSYKNPIELEVVGYNLEDLRQAGTLVMDNLSGVKGLADLSSSVKESNPEIAIEIDRERASHYGLSSSSIAEMLEKKVKGTLATHYREQDRQVEMIVEVQEDQRANLQDLGNLTVPVTGADPIPLSALAKIEPSRGPGAITRVSGSRVALITANLDGISLGVAVNRIGAKLSTVKFPRGVFYRITGQNEEMKKSISSLYLAMFLAVFLVYIAMAAQFGSLLHPFVIMFGAFYSLVGLTILFLITGTTINVFSLIGIIMMIGNSVNNAILTVSTIDELRSQGLDRHAAIVQASQFRLRPNLATSLNTIIGMIPMALPIGQGYELRIPMALAVMGGIGSSTFLTLTLIPSTYLIFDQVGDRVKAVFKGN